MKKIDYDGVLQLEIPEQDDFNAIYDAVKETMQPEDAADFMLEAIERAKKMASAEGAGDVVSSWNMFDKITWVISEAYCSGFLRGTEVAFQAIAEHVQDAQGKAMVCNANGNSDDVY